MTAHLELFSGLDEKDPQNFLGAKKTMWLETWNSYLMMSILFALSDGPNWTPELKVWSKTQLWVLHSAVSSLHHNIKKSAQSW